MSLDNLSCPLPLADYASVQLAHGGGGRLMQQLIANLFARELDNPLLAEGHDGATLEVGGARLAFTTDSFVVRPLEFPGGDIGSLAVHGTVNDLAMCGAQPLALSAGWILEEGLAMETLVRLVGSMRDAARAAGVAVVTGDTKVVDRGRGDGVYVNTAGVGIIAPGIHISPRRARAGDVVLLSGPIAEHGIAILSVREGLAFESPIVSDSAALNGLVAALLAACGGDVHVLRDPTRGGVASTLHEIASSAGVGIAIEEDAVPVREPVRGACEILGLDPLYVANEGRLLAIVAADTAERALAALREHPLGRGAVRLGKVTAEGAGHVELRSAIGGRRILDLLSGEQLPRIC
jgi:hydrogenase expression/formation protein HypE